MTNTSFSERYTEYVPKPRFVITILQFICVKEMPRGMILLGSLRMF